MKIIKFCLTLAALCYVESGYAGFFEISANGSYFKYDNGLVAGEKSTTTVRRLGGGLGYRFLQNTSVELSYTNSKNLDDFAYIDSANDEIWYLNRVTEYQNLSLSLVLDFAPRGATFRPFIRGGGGVMLRKTVTSGTATNVLNGTDRELTFEGSPEETSASAEAGLGFKVFMAKSVAVEFTGTAFATDLDKPEIFLHYSLSGGLRFVF